MKRNSIYLLFVVNILFFMNGCAGALLAGGAGAGGVAYMNGELRSTEQAGMDKTWAATLQAVHAMELETVEKEKDALTARLHAKGAGDKDVYINLKSVADHSTEIRIRVNIFGDRSMSNRILTEIQKRL